MSEDENKFDEIIREKFSSMDFPFDEENWEKAEKKIDAGRARGKFWRIVFIFLFGLFVGIAIMIPIVNHETRGGNQIVSPATETVNAEKPVLQNFSSELASQNQNTVAGAKNLPAEKSVTESEKYVSDKSNAPKNEYSGNKGIILAPANRNIALETPIRKKEIKKTESSVEFNSSTSSANISTPTNSQNIVTDANSIGDNLVSENHPNKPEQANDTSTHVAVQLIQNNIVKAIKDSPTVVIKDTSSATKLQSQNSTCANIFSIQAGANYLFGWSYGDTIEGRGFTPVLGIGFTHFFNSKWVIYTGIQYGSVAHLKVSEKTFTTSILDFGQNYIDTTIAPKWIHYAVVPLFVQYHFNSKNFIGIGSSIEYLVTITSNLVINQYSDFNGVQQLKQVASGYTEGFNSWNAAVTVAYGRKIADKFSISAEMQYGLLDIKGNTFFSTQKFERSTGIKLLLTYDLCKH